MEFVTQFISLSLYRFNMWVKKIYMDCMDFDIQSFFTAQVQTVTFHTLNKYPFSNILKYMFYSFAPSNIHFKYEMGVISGNYIA